MKVPWIVGVVVMSIWLTIAAPSSVRMAHAFTETNTFGWREVPENQDVPIRRAVFDRGGYLLYDTVGEVIAVPFTGHSVCALKFHRSHTGSMYFVNRGWGPVLYVPADDPLYNGTVSGGCWYPFAHGYDPYDPVYMSCAPNYTDYCDMGWYPGMTCYGGYYSTDYVDPGAAFVLAVGLIFLIDGHHYDGWHHYYGYWHDHGDFRHIGFFDPPAYHWASRPFGGRSFVGTRHIMALRSMHNGGFQNGGSHGFASGFHGNNGAFHGNNARTANGHFGGGRVFQGTASAIHNRNLQRMAHGGGVRAFNGGGVHRTASAGGFGRVAHTAHGFSGHTFRSANRSIGGGGTYFHRSFNGGGFTHRSFNAGGGSFARRSFSSGGFTHRSFNAGGFERHSFSGGGGFGGGHFSGGGGHFGGGGGGGGGGGHFGGGGGHFGGGGGHDGGNHRH